MVYVIAMKMPGALHSCLVFFNSSIWR